MELAPWFESDDYRRRKCYADLSDQHKQWVDQFREDGYLVLEEPGILDDTIDSALAGLIDKYEPRNEPGRIQDAWKTSTPVGMIATAPSILQALQLLYQREPIPFQTLNFNEGTRQQAHSDTIHFNTMPFGFMCGVWVALEDVDANNGPLFYYPGSQKLPVFHMEDLGIEAEATEYQKYEECIKIVLSERGFSSRQAHLKKGQAFVWSSNIFHGGSPVADPTRTRFSQVTHYYFPGCIYYTPMLSAPSKQIWTLRQVEDIRTQTLVPQYLGLRQEHQKPSLRQRIIWRLGRLKA
jgi:Phytanoyl-CoA dioxygenase (PhyH)